VKLLLLDVLNMSIAQNQYN